MGRWEAAVTAQVQGRKNDERPAKYWLVKCGGGYWLAEGGCTPKQRKAERHKTREKASRRRKLGLSQGEKATWLVRVVAPIPITT